jgi:hypothetical protein
LSADQIGGAIHLNIQPWEGLECEEAGERLVALEVKPGVLASRRSP